MTLRQNLIISGLLKMSNWILILKLMLSQTQSAHLQVATNTDTNNLILDTTLITMCQTLVKITTS